MSVLETVRSSWKAAGLRNRLLFTLAMLLVFRLGAHVAVPFIDATQAARLLEGNALLGFIDVISGGAFRTLSIFAMSVGPYITASIIVQLLTIVIPKLEEMQKEGEEGRKKIQQYVRYGTVALGLVQAFGLTTTTISQAMPDPSWLKMIIIIISLTAGTAFLMWLGEQITEKGIGNGISLLIFFGIVSRLPSAAGGLWTLVGTGNAGNIGKVLLVLVAALLIVGFTVLINEGVRRIPVQYAKRVVGRRMYGGQTTYLPLKVNQAGVIPVIFASSLLLFPQTVASFFLTGDNWFYQAVDRWLGPSGPIYLPLFGLLVIAFTFFYTQITFNPVEIANNIKKAGGFIPGIRPGKPTSEYLERISVRITLAGALALALLVMVPYALIAATGIQYAAIGGTALLIVVGVALETMRQVEAHLVMRNYQGFMK